MLELDRDCLHRVGAHLPARDLAVAGATCRRLRAAFGSRDLWEPLRTRQTWVWQSWHMGPANHPWGPSRHVLAELEGRFARLPPHRAIAAARAHDRRLVTKIREWSWFAKVALQSEGYAEFTSSRQRDRWRKAHENADAIRERVTALHAQSRQQLGERP